MAGGQTKTTSTLAFDLRTFKTLSSMFIVMSAVGVFLLFYIVDPLRDYKLKIVSFNSTKIANVINDTKTKTTSPDCFQSPYVVCDQYDAQDVNRKARQLRQQFVNTNASTEWIPIIHDRVTDSARNKTFGKVIRVAVYRRPPYIPLESFNFSSCRPYNNCQFVGDKVHKDVDVVVVNGVHLNVERKLPRWPHQVYVFMGWESPYHTGELAKNPNNQWNYAFNLTMNYGVTSDIFVPYARLFFTPKPPHQLPNYVEVAKQKTKMVVWFVSNCSPQNKRNSYVAELKKHIEVDVFGRCGKPCPKNPDYCGSDLNKYRFYLSFENSNCDDYVTEKFFKIFQHQIIPVVMGSANYTKYFPPKTFITISDFQSPKDLAIHLKNLSKDFQAYSQYIQAVGQYTNKPAIGKQACALCRELNHIDLTKSQYYDMKTWLSGNHCRR